MKVLVTGATGFVGSYLTKELSQQGYEVVPTNLTGANACDLTNPKAVGVLINKIKPEAVCHLAAMPHVGKSWDDEPKLKRVNVGATDNLCAALSTLKKPVLFLFVSSSMVYGSSTNHERFDEKNIPNPNTPYGTSKLAAERVVKHYQSETFTPYIVRPFNHFGAGQSPDFVCPAFAKRIAEAPDGGEIEVGNLEAKRDFTDVRDMVEGYRLILDKKPKEKLFVLGSGKATKIKEIAEKLIKISGKNITLTVKEKMVRTKDPSEVIANPTLAQTVLGWKPKVSLDQGLKDLYLSD